MATLTLANAQALADSVAKHIIDSVALVGSPSGIQAGQQTTLSKIATLNDPAQQYLLLDGFETFVNNESAWLTQEALYNAILDLAYPAAAALDKAAPNGLAAYLTTGPNYVDPHFLDAFNRAFYRSAGFPQALLAAWQAFGQALANMGQFNFSGSGAGAFVDGSKQQGYGNAPLSIFNAGAGNTGAAASTLTVTYSAYNASGVLQTGLTASATIPASSAPGAAVSLAVSGVDVTNITATGGTSGDQVGVKSTLLRAVTY